MDFTDEDKKRVESKIVEAMIGGLDKDELDSEDLPEIAGFVLDRIDNVKNHDELMGFLRELSAKNRIFTNILVVESGEIKEKVESEVAQGVLHLAQSGKIEDAIKLARSQTASQGGTN